MYSVYLINFGYELEQRYDTFVEAKAKGVDTGFEFAIKYNGEIVTAEVRENEQTFVQAD